MAVMDPTSTTVQTNGGHYAWQGADVPAASKSVVADAVPPTSLTIIYHRELAAAFVQRAKAPDDRPLDFDPDDL